MCSKILQQIWLSLELYSMTHGYATQAKCFHVKYTHRYILYTQVHTVHTGTYCTHIQQWDIDVRFETPEFMVMKFGYAGVTRGAPWLNWTLSRTNCPTITTNMSESFPLNILGNFLTPGSRRRVRLGDPGTPGSRTTMVRSPTFR